MPLTRKTITKNHKNNIKHKIPAIKIKVLLSFWLGFLKIKTIHRKLSDKMIETNAPIAEIKEIIIKRTKAEATSVVTPNAPETLETTGSGIKKEVIEAGKVAPNHKVRTTAIVVIIGCFCNIK